MIKILFVCHGRTNGYCSEFELSGQNGENKGDSNCAKGIYR